MPHAYRAPIFHCIDDPGAAVEPTAVEYFDDGLLLIEAGCVAALGPAANVLGSLPPGIPVTDYRDKILVPGFIDTHVHSAQLDIVAAPGARLLDWLERYAYPEEARFADPEHAAASAGAFVEELLRNGTTTALVFATVHPGSVDALFEAALNRNMRLVAGKVLMDRNCPTDLSDDPDSAYDDSKTLLERWHGRGRLGYAITPRFALTSSPEQLEAAGRLAAEYPDAWIHTHLAEDHAEIEAIERLYPDSSDYLDVYDRFGLVREKSVFAHCLHLEDRELRCLAAKRGAAAFCPTSNLFLGSGLFDLDSMARAGVPVGLATDVGGGTSLSMLRTMGEGFKVLHMRDQALPAERAFYLATLGAARALRLDDCLGNFAVGKEADFVVLDPDASSISARRMARTTTLREKLFALMFLGDERHVHATYLAGRRYPIASPGNAAAAG